MMIGSVSRRATALGAALVAGVCLSADPASPTRRPGDVQRQASAVALVRPATAAGTFYPADRGKLRQAVERFVRMATPRVRPDAPRVVVVPHAGYGFSGQIVADALVQTAGAPIRTVIVVGTNHTTPGFDRIGVFKGDGWLTPLGRVDVNQWVARAIVDGQVGATFANAVHVREHSIEVVVPFLQVLHPAAAIVPVIVGAPELAMCRRLGALLARLAADPTILIVASSDLSHYPRVSEARRLDAELLAMLGGEHMEAALVAAEVETRERAAADGRGLVTRACGLGPLLAAREAARGLAAEHIEVVSAATSAESPHGTDDRVVGYAAVGFWPGSWQSQAPVPVAPAADGESPLTDEDRTTLLRLARVSIEHYLTSDTTLLPRGGSPRLLRRAGVFVTLTVGGTLRGCIGRIVPEGTVLKLTSAMALQAAFADPRFPPVRHAELRGLRIEVSVLTVPRDIRGPGEIVPGRDGVVMRLGDKAAVFLPQVATEQGWGRTELLEQLALKAGLDAQAWRNTRTRFQTFQAEAFSEGEHR